MVDFAVHAGPFIQAEIKVVFASVDSVENVSALKEGLRVGFPMYAEVDPVATGEATGAFMQTGERPMMHATGFVVRPDGTIHSATYSTGPIGRMTPTEVLRSVLFYRSQN